MLIKIRNKQGFVISVVEDEELTIELVGRKVKGYTPLVFIRTEPTTEENGNLVIQNDRTDISR